MIAGPAQGVGGQDAGAGFTDVAAERGPAPARTAAAIVQATTHFADSVKLAEVSEGLGDAMEGQEISTLSVRMQERGSTVSV